MPVEINGEVGTSGADPEWISARATLSIRHIIKRAILPPHYRSRNLAAILIGIAPLASRTCANPEAVLLPFRSIRSLILVDAKMNGNPATLLLDTGANNTIINAKKYGKVQAPRIEPVSKGPGLVGNVLRLRVDLEIGGWFLFSQPVSVMNLDSLKGASGSSLTASSARTSCASSVPYAPTTAPTSSNSKSNSQRVRLSGHWLTVIGRE